MHIHWISGCDSFEVPVPAGNRLSGTVLSEHLRSFDWIARRAEFHSKAPQEVVDAVTGRIRPIMSM